MIYNLFRSNILRIEVLNYLNILKKTYNNDTQKIQAVFLPYWDSIIDGEGYPTAYFVSGFDTKEVFFSEIKKRIRRGSKDIRIYSRTIDRNKKIEKWCKEFSKDNGCLCSKTKTYKLGTTPAVKIRIMKNDS